MSTPRTVSVFPILLVNFIGTFGFSLVLPFLVFLVLDFGGNELIYGLVGAVYSGFQFIGAPILGRWSDKYGRRIILLLSQGGTFLAWCLFVVALLVPHISWFEVEGSFLGDFSLTLPLVILVVARALDGLTGGNISVAQAYMADITDEENRKKNYGQLAASTNLGFMLGPALAGLLGATVLGELLPVSLALVISLVAMLLIYFRLPESKPCVPNWSFSLRTKFKAFGQDKECFETEGENNRLGFSAALRLPNVGLMISLYFLIFLAFNFFYVGFPIYAVKSLDWSTVQLGIFFTLISSLTILVEGPILTRLAKRFAESTLIVVGGILLTVNFVLIVLGGEYGIWIAALFFACGNGLMWPSFLALLASVAGTKHQGAIQGYASSGGSLASVIGLVAGGFLYGLIGTSSFLIAAALMGIIVLIVGGSFRK
ncbi:MAG: MFS transporter [Bacteroidota bacterium]